MRGASSQSGGALCAWFGFGFGIGLGLGFGFGLGFRLGLGLACDFHSDPRGARSWP